MTDPTDSPSDTAPWSLTRTVLTPVAVVLGLVLLATGLFALGLGRMALSAWGLAWSAEALVLGVALLTAFLKGPRLRVLQITSVACLLALVLVRIASRGETRGAALVVIDRDGQATSSARLVDRLFEERDAAIVGSRALVAVGAVPAREFPTLPTLLAASYRALEDGGSTDGDGLDASALGSPIAATLLGLQRPDASDTLVVEPSEGEARVGVVFLHGYAGSFALMCLEVALGLRGIPARVACPSTSFGGAWWRPDGEATARSTIAYLRSRGAERVVLVGLSNGARGAAQLAPRLGREIDALVLLSGTATTAPAPRVPTLVVQGSRDTMMSTSRVRAWAAQHPAVRYVELPGTHFLLVEDRDAVRREVRSFVEDVIRF